MGWNCEIPQIPLDQKLAVGLYQLEDLDQGKRNNFASHHTFSIINFQFINTLSITDFHIHKLSKPKYAFFEICHFGKAI